MNTVGTGAEAVSSGRAFDALSAIALLEGDSDNATFRSAPAVDAILDTFGHRVFNFEVHRTHTYIADGIRVHNTSALSYIEDGEIVIDVNDTNQDGRIDEYTAIVHGGEGVVVTRNPEPVAGEDTQTVTKNYTINRDGVGPVELEVENIWVTEDGEQVRVSSDIISANLRGSEIGGETLQSLTPFLSAALLGDDASVFGNVAVNTVLDALLENVGEVAGGAIEIATSWLEEITGVNSEGQNVVEQLAELTFEDFGGDLIEAGVTNSISAINQLIMAEIFEDATVDGVPGAVLEAIASSSINEVLRIGLGSPAFQQTLVDIGLEGSAFARITNEIPGSFPGGDISGWSSLVFTAVINEILPSHETLEGMVASSVATAFVNSWAAVQNLGLYAAGPVAAVAGFMVGKVFDHLFDEDPQAWTKVGYDSDLGKFVLLGTWSDDGGNTGMSEQLATLYVDAMNQFVELAAAEDHNYPELGNWTFGHFESFISNGGFDGQSFLDIQSAYTNAYVTDLAQAELNDGRMAIVQGLEDLEVSRLQQEYKDFGKFASILDLIAEMEKPEAGSFTLEHDPNLPDHPLYGSTFNWTAEQSFAERFDAFVFAAFESVLATLMPGATTYEQGDPTIAWSSLLADVQAALPFFEYAERPIIVTDPDSGETQTQSWEDFLYDTVTVGAGEDETTISVLNPERAIDSVHAITGLQDALDQFGIEAPVFYSDADIRNRIDLLLQAGGNYYTYLEDPEVVNALMLSAPETPFAGGWVATLSLIEELGLNKPYDLNGTSIDNAIYTADGDDSVNAGNGDDIVKAYGGHDEVIGGGGYDTIYGGTGDDNLRGNSEDDSVFGGAGSDTLFGGFGADHINGESGDDSLTGGSGNDSLYGGGGQDILYSAGYHDLVFAESWDENRDPVAVNVFQLYAATLDRAPDQQGHLSWVDQISNSSASLTIAAEGLISSAEFDNRFGELSNQEFVAHLYLSGLGRNADANGLASWTAHLDNGTKSRAEVAVGISQSPEADSYWHEDSFFYTQAGYQENWIEDVFQLHKAVFAATPELSDLLQWTEDLAKGGSLSALVEQFTTSSEFQTAYGSLSDDDFVTAMYNDILGRAPDPTGFATWTGRLSSGSHTRDDVVLTFSQSAEFSNGMTGEVQTWIIARGTDDVLEGGSGNDILFGGLLSDVFVFDGSNGTDQIVDFEPWDQLQLSGLDVGTADAFQAALVQTGDDVRYDESGLSIIFLDVQLSELQDDSQFVFV